MPQLSAPFPVVQHRHGCRGPARLKSCLIMKGEVGDLETPLNQAFLQKSCWISRPLVVVMGTTCGQFGPFGRWNLQQLCNLEKFQKWLRMEGPCTRSKPLKVAMWKKRMKRWMSTKECLIWPQRSTLSSSQCAAAVWLQQVWGLQPQNKVEECNRHNWLWPFTDGVEILLMEEILHHLGCTVNNGINYF